MSDSSMQVTNVRAANAGTSTDAAGAFEDYEGRVLLDGRDARDVAVQDRGIGILYQDYVLFPT